MWEYEKLTAGMYFIFEIERLMKERLIMRLHWVTENGGIVTRCQEYFPFNLTHLKSVLPVRLFSSPPPLRLRLRVCSIIVGLFHSVQLALDQRGHQTSQSRCQAGTSDRKGKLCWQPKTNDLLTIFVSLCEFFCVLSLLSHLTLLGCDWMNVLISLSENVHLNLNLITKLHWKGSELLYFCIVKWL